MAHLNLIFDPGFFFGFNYPSKTPMFPGIIIHTPKSQMGEIRSTTQVYPIWEITYDLEWARGAENIPSSLYNYMLGFFLQVQGSLSDFLYLDPNDNTATKQLIGIGDGVTTSFQLQRSIANGFDIVQNLNGTPTIYANNADVSTADYTISQTGIVVFATAPAAGTVLTWSGNFYYRVRFASDEMRFDQMMNQIWESKEIRLQSVILGSLLS